MEKCFSYSSEKFRQVEFSSEFFPHETGPRYPAPFSPLTFLPGPGKRFFELAISCAFGHSATARTLRVLLCRLFGTKVRYCLQIDDDVSGLKSKRSI